MAKPKKINKAKMMRDWFAIVFPEHLTDTPGIEQATPSTIKESYEEEHGEIYGACAVCDKIAHSAPIGFQYELSSKQSSKHSSNEMGGSINFCSWACVEKLDAGHGYHHLLNKRGENQNAK